MGLTPIHWAAQQGDKDSMQVLLKFSANPNLVDRNGLTALHWAASGGNRSCISQLLEAGADVRAMDRDHRKPQEMADRYNNRWAWNAAVEEVGSKADGTRVRRPLSEVCDRPGLVAAIAPAPAASLKDADMSVAQCENYHILHPQHHFLHHFYNRKRIPLVYEYRPVTCRLFHRDICSRSLPLLNSGHPC
jgi:hypothetical protein